MLEFKVHRLAKYKKLDPLEFSYDPYGKPRLTRWKSEWGWKPNAIAVEDILPGGLVKVEGVNLKEVRNG